MRRISITGTRRGLTDLQDVLLDGLLDFGGLGETGEFHHGSCRGVDVQAAQLVCRSFVPGKVRIVAHPGHSAKGRDLAENADYADSGVDDEVLPSKTHFARNRDLVTLCDELIACPGKMEEEASGGTWYTINYARKVGKPLTIIWPDGGLTTENQRR